MGANFAKWKVSLADEKHLFKYITSQNKFDRDATFDRLWVEEDTNKSNYFERKEALHFFNRVYDYLSTKDGVKFKNTKEDLIKGWIDLFDTNKDGKISLEEFKENLQLLIENPKIENFKSLIKDKNISKVLELTKLSLIDLPTMDKLTSTDPFVEVSTEILGTVNKKQTPIIYNNNGPVADWEPAFVYFSANCLTSEFIFNIFDDDKGIRKEDVGTFKINVMRVLNEKLKELTEEEKEKVVFLTFEGPIELSPKASFISEKEHKKPTYKVEFNYEQLLKLHTGPSSNTEMNKFNKLFWKASKGATNISPVNACDVAPPKSKTPLYKTDFMEFGKIRIYRKEKTSGSDFNIIKRLGSRYIVSKAEEENDLVPWTHQEAKTFLEKEDVIRLIPKPLEGEWWKDFTSDKTLTRFFFQGIGATRIAKRENGFVVDFDSLKQYTVREGYAKPQGKLLFNLKGEVECIEYIGEKYYPKNGDDKWEHLKFLFRSTALISVTAQEHLCMGHLIWSNLTTAATHTQLSPNHPIRRLLHIHTYRTSFVNQQAIAVLLPKGGALQHVVCWPYKDLCKLLDDTWVTFKYETFAKFLERTGMKDVDRKLYPLAEDGLDFWDIVNRYVRNYFKVYYPTENELNKEYETVEFWKYLSKSFPPNSGFPQLLTLQNITEVLTQFIFYVSAMHTQVGYVGAYARDPTFAAGCVGLNQRIAFPQNYYTQIAITMGTAGPMPMMLHDWSHLFETNEAKSVWTKFHEELQDLSSTILQRNKFRNWPYNNFNPLKTHTSIAV